MIQSYAWNWKESKDQTWLEPSEESYFLADRWKKEQKTTILDIGCGLGRHTVFFAKQGFNVFGIDLSTESVRQTSVLAMHENVQIHVQEANMLELPFDDNSFDCIFAYHVIYHCDTSGIRKVINEIRRVLKPEGEVYCTLYSKNTISFQDKQYPQIDKNTLIKMEDGPEKGIPHFFANLEDIFELFRQYHIIEIRHTDDCYIYGKKQDFKHYFVLASKCNNLTDHRNTI